MFCTQCGKKLVDNAKFCAYCGAKVELLDNDVSSQNDYLSTDPKAKTNLDNKYVDDNYGDKYKERIISKYSVSTNNYPADEFVKEVRKNIHTNGYFHVFGSESTDGPFLMPIEDVFTITGRGTVVTGRVERGILRLNDTVEIIGLTNEPRKTVVVGIEMFRKLIDEAVAGDNISIRFNSTR